MLAFVNLDNLGLMCLLRGCHQWYSLVLHVRRLRREYNNFLTWHSKQGHDGDSVGTGSEAVNPRVMVQRDAPDSDESPRIDSSAGSTGSNDVQNVAPETDNAADEVWETCADENGFCSCLGTVRFGLKAGHPGGVIATNSPFGKVKCGTMYVTAARFFWSSLAAAHLAPAPQI